MNIYQRINKVREAVSYVQKDAEIQQGNRKYSVVTHDNVTAQVREHLIKHGIAIVPSQLCSHTEQRTYAKGGLYTHFRATFEISFINIDDPTDRFPIVIEAHADDSSDKAPGKALSYAVKNGMLKLFNLETGENEEGRVEAERRENALVQRVADEARDYLDNSDYVALALLERQVGPEAWTEVYNSAPEGKKSEWKKELSNSIKTGHTILKTINTAILTDDAGAAAENVHDMTDGGKRLLFQYLGGEKGVKLGELIKSIQTGDEA